MEKLKNISSVVTFILLFVIYSALLEQYPLFRLNAIIALIIVVSWFFSSFGLGHPTEYISYTDWTIGHKLKHHWVFIMIFVTAFCFPIGLMIRKIYYFNNLTKDGEFKNKFYFFFERKTATL